MIAIRYANRICTLRVDDMEALHLGPVRDGHLPHTGGGYSGRDRSRPSRGGR